MKRHSLPILLSFLTIPALQAQAEQKLTDRLSLTGLVETEAAYSDTEGESSSDITLATLELGLEAQVNDWISAQLLLLYEEDGTDGIEVDEAFVTLTPEGLPLFVDMGRYTQPFGAFPSTMISDPLTLELGETKQQAGVNLGYADETFLASLSVYKGDVQKTGKDEVNTLVAMTSFNGEEGDFRWDIGASWTNNIGDSDTLQEDDKETSDLVGGWSAYLATGMGEFCLMAEYLGATEEFEDGSNTGKKPAAWNTELAWDMPSPLSVAVRVGGADDYEVERHYGGTVAWELAEGATVGLEYLRIGKVDDTDTDQVTMQLAAEF
ncbi:LbtU family siderophore porin [Prosthecochloris sp. CIB 2401]|uniref:LbtU family siderophore porin n=1 Tax=Prosthecochloris sp. CIB 2401 TaxID=1868325 RepID=UPI00080AAE96|nr:LbtU family siderophore porin [Prosthecochloris sp. CIB 2401]ANT64388.1 hypothetical protein Ptc2401_00589 [Prosthecochloris sp. CIB 2401]